MPWTVLIFLAALMLPWVGSRYDTFIGTQIAIYSLFALSLNLLLGTTGLVSFGHAAYFGIGSYGCGILMKVLGVPFWLSFPAAGLIAAAFAVVFGFFCVRLTKIYFAMLTLAFAQIVWAICFKWNDLTGGDQGLPVRDAYRRLVEQGWTDGVRALTRCRIYTFWKYFRNAFARDAGLRIDHLLLILPLPAALSPPGSPARCAAAKGRATTRPSGSNLPTPEPARAVGVDYG